MKKNRIALLFAFVLMLLSPLAVHAYTIPEPSDDLYVSDYADVIDREVEEEIINANLELEEKNGVQIAVVTVDFLDGAAIEDYAYDLFNQWGIGSAESNNGVLLLLAIGEDNYYCLAGDGLSNLLSAGRIKLLLNEYLEPDFASGDYSAGVSKTFDAIYDLVKDSSGTPIIQEPIYNDNSHYNSNSGSSTSSHRSSSVGIFSLLLGIFVLIVVFSMVLSFISAFTRPRGYVRRRPYWGGFFGPHVIIHHDHHDRYDHHDRGPRPPRGGGFGGGSSGRSFGGGRSSGGSRSFGGGRSSGGGRSFGGGSSRGGGAGRH